MLIARVQRPVSTIIPKSPWAFHQHQPPVPLKPFSFADRALFRNQIPEGFKYAHKALIDALGTHDYAALGEFLEGKLYHRVEGMMKEIEFKGYRMEVVEEGGRDPEAYNVGVHMGVHIQRMKNPSKEDFFQVVNLEQFKSTINPEFINNLLKSRGIVSTFDLLKHDLSNYWIYMSPNAPAKAVIAVDVVYRGRNQITMKRREKDVIYTDRTQELHLIRFECNPLDLGTQQDISSRGFTDLLNSVLGGDINVLEAAWEITDIDYVMQGNPYLVTKKELAR